MVNHPNRSKPAQAMPDEVIDLTTEKSSRMVKFMQFAASLGMGDGMVGKPVKTPYTVKVLLFPGGFEGIQEAANIWEIYKAAYRIGKLRLRS